MDYIYINHHGDTTVKQYVILYYYYIFRIRPDVGILYSYDFNDDDSDNRKHNIMIVINDNILLSSVARRWCFLDQYVLSRKWKRLNNNNNILYILFNNILSYA